MNLKNWDIRDIFRHTKISHRDMARILAISERSLNRWMANPRLAEKSHRFQMLKEICAASEGVITYNKLGQWLARPQKDLTHHAPITLLRKIEGYRDVLKLIGSIRGGTYA
jgi:putative toxin-antitoxin system antitoxin component (TIGR02293 family)